MDESTTIEQIKKSFNKFCDDRNWTKYHDAKEMAIDISIEAAELLEHFRYKDKEEIKQLMKDPEKIREVKHEMADILGGIMRICGIYDIDLSDAFFEKLELNEEKYPLDKAKGSNKKYTEF